MQCFDCCNAEASVCCAVCELALCNECAAVIHARKAFARHALTPLASEISADLRTTLLAALARIQDDLQVASTTLPSALPTPPTTASQSAVAALDPIAVTAVHIAFVFSHPLMFFPSPREPPQNVNDIDFSVERMRVLEALSRDSATRALRVREYPATRDQLGKALRAGAAILHFSGHADAEV